MKKSKGKGESSSGQISDPRFASFETDPRFRLPSKKTGKTTIDKRFSRMLKDDEFVATARVDRYGRKLKSDTKKKALQRLYDEDEDEKEGEEEDGDISVEEDEIVQRELRAAEANYDPARGGGFDSSSEDESDSDDDQEPAHEQQREGDLQRFQDEQGELEAGEVTNRIAIVNLDWDHVRATDLYALFSSFVGDSGGKVERVSVYPSEFGKERMQQEELEGPPKELFKGKKQEESEEDSDEDSDSDEAIRKQLMQEGDDQDFDSDALRSYQLDRLRYYYAVMVCSDKNTAHKIYEATDGTEYQASSNFLDLRFVPDDVTFDDEPRDECDSPPEEYKPVEFVTNALQSSKVKLTWDMHPEEHSRKESIKRAFSGSRKEIDENDLKTYLASDSEDESEDQEENDVEVVVAEGAEAEPKLSKKELARKKMREALGLTDESSSKSSKREAVGDMQITFTPALSANEPKKDADAEETTIEKYKRKERERKERKRQQAKAKRAGPDGEESEEEQHVSTGAQEEDLGFDDPFFTNEAPSAPSKASMRKEERLKKRAAREAAEAESAAEKANLRKVMAADKSENQADHLDHFDMNEIMRAEKQKRKKGKGKGKTKGGEDGEAAGLQEGFEMNVEDDRFKAVFENHEYAIDPSNPKFKGTEAMKKVLEEGRKKRSGGGEDEDRGQRKKSKRR
ncbi:hypothetical protein NLU13_5913 [Sarocladium strictum]|uniref:NUC153 domain-containing protein n=1 Tax=Sarocladium strictum TaxID=5046 RepID=A0AA39GF89_SARSR|nr:hypothetical protein NLU13_5913 [Sarocladium strictum]